MPQKTKILVVDDSATICRFLAKSLNAIDEFEVVATANSGERAIVQTESHRPDVIILDLKMEGMGGLAAIEHIMAETPTPIIVLSGMGQSAIDATVAALERGAVDYVPKYREGKKTNPEVLVQTLVAKIRIAASIKVPDNTNGAKSGVKSNKKKSSSMKLAKELVIIGASTGGPKAIQEMLGKMPQEIDYGVIIVQHLPRTFTRSFALQLNRFANLPVREASDRDEIHAGEIIVVPGDRHLVVEAEGKIRLNSKPKVNGHRPSIDVTMESAAKVYKNKVVGVLLTGMGDDGAKGLLALKNAGSKTFAQDESSCVVYGMPMRAVQIGAVCEVANPLAIAQKITRTQNTLKEVLL